MHVERLFSKLEHQTSEILANIRTAVEKSQLHIDIVERDIHTLFKFMDISQKRSVQCRDEMENPYRENDFLFQRMFGSSRNRGGASNPRQFWLEVLVYLLERSHETILADAEETSENIVADTYKYIVDHYTLQIWKAADGYEFFLNERLVDFEGDTQSCLGSEMKSSGPQLMWMTWEDPIHMILPISPDVAVVFCDESRCWESPFAESMHRLKLPYPENSLLKDAPHKDIVNVAVKSVRTRKKRWPATTAWRVSIGKLSREHHQIIASYSLSHAKSFVVAQRRARFERGKRELVSFSKKRAEAWASRGVRFGNEGTSRKHSDEIGTILTEEERLSRVVENHMSALDEMVELMRTTSEPLKRTKDHMWKSWLAVRALETCGRKDAKSSFTTQPDISKFNVVHPVLQAAFEAAYPKQSSDFRNLLTIDFGQFFSYGLGEEKFAELTSKIDLKIAGLVRNDSSRMHWDAHVPDPESPSRNGPSNDRGVNGSTTDQTEESVLNNPCFKSMVRAAQTFDVLKWMFEYRQDILATFVHQLTVPQESLQPNIIRMRSVRK